MSKFKSTIITVKQEDPKTACNGRMTIDLIVGSLWMLFLLITLAFQLNHHRHLNNDPTEIVLIERMPVRISMELCSQEDEIKLQIPEPSFRSFDATKDSGDSKVLQSSLLQIAEKFSKNFIQVKMSDEQIGYLAHKLNQQLEYVNGYLDQSDNTVGFVKVIQEPLKSVSELTEKIAHLYYSITGQFDELFRLVKTVADSSKKRNRLETAVSIIDGQMNTSIHGRQELEKAMGVLKNISVDLNLRSQRDQAEFKTALHLWQSLQENKNSTNCFANWEWNWWPFTYTTTSVCYGKPSEEDLANTKARFEQALWRYNCSTQTLGNLQDKMQKWDRLDSEIFTTIETLEKNKFKLEQDMGHLNGTSSGSPVQLKRETCKFTKELKYLYSDASEFFMNVSSRFVDSLAIWKAVSFDSFSGSAPTLNDPFLELKNDLKKTVGEVQDREAKYALVSAHIFGPKGISLFVKRLKKMTERKTMNSVNLMQLLATARKSLNFGHKRKNKILQICDTFDAEN